MAEVMPKVFRAEFRRTVTLLWRSPVDILNPSAFFVLGLALFALGFGGEPAVLGRFSAVVIWVLVLLAALLSVESLFRRDYEDGVLEQTLLLARPGFLAVLAKLLAHWLAFGLCFLLLGPFAALALNLPEGAWPTLMLTLLLGSPAVTALAAIGAALTVGMGRGGVLLSLLVLPFLVPILIFSTSATAAAQQGLPHTGSLLWLAVVLVVTLTTAPFAVLAALRIAIEQ